MAQLARQPAGTEKDAQSHANVGCDEHGTVELGQNEGEAQEDGVAGLVGREAVVVGERRSVCQVVV